MLKGTVIRLNQFEPSRLCLSICRQLSEPRRCLGFFYPSTLLYCSLSLSLLACLAGNQFASLGWSLLLGDNKIIYWWRFTICHNCFVVASKASWSLLLPMFVILLALFSLELSSSLACLFARLGNPDFPASLESRAQRSHSQLGPCSHFKVKQPTKRPLSFQANPKGFQFLLSANFYT